MNTKSILLFLSLVIYSIVFGQDKRTAEIDKMMQYAAANGYFNGAIAVADKGKIVYSRCFGYADMQKKEKNDSNTLFNLCSISKQFTAMGIMMLKEEGKLSYEDKLEKYFPSLPYPGITLRHLLNHTSGLPDYLLALLQTWTGEKVPDNEDAVNYLSHNKLSVKFTPGEKFEYCNTGYMLLACIIEKVSGKSYPDFLKERIFSKLGMNRTTIYLRGITKTDPPNFARPYAYDAGENKFVLTSEYEQYKRQVNTLDGNYGDGGIYSTITDMLRWDAELKNITLVKKETLQEAFTSGKNNAGLDIGYGFGWFIVNDPVQGKFIQHTGGWPGFRQAFIRYLDKDRTLLVLRNTEINFSSIQLAIQNILDEKPWIMPVPSLLQLLALHSENAASIRKAFEEFKKDVAPAKEEDINNEGYQMMQAGRVEQALEVMKINAELFPKSWNVYDSLGELYLANGDKGNAKLNYQKSLELNPANDGAKKALSQL
jgi:CubicO group peptidase (beta-lactamase class C family)